MEVIVLKKCGSVGMTESLLNAALYRDADRIILPDSPPKPMPILQNHRAPSLLLKILSALLLARLPRNQTVAIRRARSRDYPTHCFMRVRRRKLKGWQKAAR